MKAGQWTAQTQKTSALVRALTRHPGEVQSSGLAFRAELDGLVLRRRSNADVRSSNRHAVAAAPIGVQAALHGGAEGDVVPWIEAVFSEPHGHPSGLAAGVGQAFAIKQALRADSMSGHAFVQSVADEVRRAEIHFGGDRRVSLRLKIVAEKLDSFPLDLQDLCGGTGEAADESFPFAVAMFARGPGLAEASLLSAINVGGDASAIGAMVGALLGARNGWSAFPPEWRTGLEESERLQDEANTLLRGLL